MKLNTPSPLVPQGSMPDKRGKSQVRIFVFTIIAVHAVFLGALLLQGCKRTGGADPMASNVDTNYPPPPIDTSTPPPTATPQSLAQSAVPPIIETQSTQVVQSSGTSPVASAPPRMEIPPPSSTLVQSGSEHVVVKGDVYATIAKKYGVSVKSLTEANPGINPSRLKIGQKLAVPAASVGSSANGTLTSGNGATNGEKTYVVKSGDSLMKIARENGTTLKSLRSANHLKTDQIKVGQKLVIPPKGAPDTGVGGTSGAPQTLPAP